MHSFLDRKREAIQAFCFCELTFKIKTNYYSSFMNSAFAFIMLLIQLCIFFMN